MVLISCDMTLSTRSVVGIAGICCSEFWFFDVAFDDRAVVEESTVSLSL